MKNLNQANRPSVSRRSFIQTSAAAVGAVTALRAPFVHASSETQAGVKIGVIGCGGRGTGALLDAVGAATKVIYPQDGFHTEDVAEGATVEKKDIQVVALADLFEDRLERCNRNLDKLNRHGPEGTLFRRIRCV